MQKTLVIFMLMAGLSLWGPLATAQIMGDLSTFQGHLTDAIGNPVPDGLIEVRFSIHDAPSGGAELWAEMDTVQVTNGLVIAHLGLNTPLVPDIFTAGGAGHRYLEIKLGSDQPLSTRLLIGGAPTSMASARVLGDIETAPNRVAITDGTSGWFGDIKGESTIMSFAFGPAFEDTNIFMSADNSGGRMSITGANNVSELVVIAAVDGPRMTAKAGDLNWDIYIEQGPARIIESMFLDAGTPIMETEGSTSGADMRLFDNLGNRVIELHPDGLIEARKGSFGDNNSLNGISTFVAGNANTVNGNFSSVLGGNSNSALGGSATVAGGAGNVATFGAAFIGGGQNNTASALNSAILGGLNNEASGQQATVSGGADNTASGDYSFAAGRGAQATHMGSFVWSDASGADFNSEFNNQFSVRAIGGTVIYSSSDLGAGVRLPAGTSQWQIVSDRNAKRNIRPTDGNEILMNLAQLPISRWSYKTENPGTEHIGPMAQDFHRLFGVGEDDRHISELDPAGVALVGVQELLKKIEALEKRVAELEAENGQVTK